MADFETPEESLSRFLAERKRKLTKRTRSEHDNYLAWKDHDIVCEIETVKGKKIHVYNQPFSFPGETSVWWAANTEDDERGFFVDGMMLSFKYLNPPSDHESAGWDTIAFDPRYDEWLNKLRRIWFEIV